MKSNKFIFVLEVFLHRIEEMNLLQFHQGF